MYRPLVQGHVYHLLWRNPKLAKKLVETPWSVCVRSMPGNNKHVKSFPTAAWNLGEQKGKVLGHRVWLVRGGKEPVRLQAAVLVVLLDRKHLVLALGHACSVGVTLARQGVLERGNLLSMRQPSKTMFKSVHPVYEATSETASVPIFCTVAWSCSYFPSQDLCSAVHQNAHREKQKKNIKQ